MCAQVVLSAHVCAGTEAHIDIHCLVKCAQHSVGHCTTRDCVLYSGTSNNTASIPAHVWCSTGLKQLCVNMLATIPFYLQAPATTPSGSPVTVYSAPASRRLLQSQTPSNVTATFGYTTTPPIASNFTSSFNTSQFDQALNAQGAKCRLCCFSIDVCIYTLQIVELQQ